MRDPAELYEFNPDVSDVPEGLHLVAGLTGLLTVLVLVAACSSSKKAASGGGGSTAPASGSITVQVKDFSFEPQNITVTTGTKVTWMFDDSAKHNVTAKDNSFKSTDLAAGGSFSYTFNSKGTYDYLCTIHQYMTGTVTVMPL